MAKYKHLEVILYPKNGWDETKIEQEIQQRTSVDKYVIALHDQDLQKDGSPIKAHYHVYLHFGNNTTWSCESVAKWFCIPPNNVNRIKDRTNGMYTTIEYYTHSKCSEKHSYDPRTFTANFDIIHYLESERKKQQKNTRKEDRKNILEETLQKIENGEVKRYNIEAEIGISAFSQFKPQIERAFEYTDMQYKAEHKGKRNMTVLWLWGETATGKTTMSFLLAENQKATAYQTHSGNDPFDSYKDEPVVILDDIRPDTPFGYAELLKLLDPYHLSEVHSRYRDKLIKADWIIVTSVFSPMKFYEVCPVANRETDSGAQLFRRIYESWEMTEQTINICTFDADRKCFQAVRTAQNPVPTYLKKQETQPKPQINTSSILNSINAQFGAIP